MLRHACSACLWSLFLPQFILHVALVLHVSINYSYDFFFNLNYIGEKILSRTLADSPKRKSNWTGSPFKAWSHIIGHKIARELAAIGSTTQLTQPSVSVHAAAPVQKRVGRAHF